MDQTSRARTRKPKLPTIRKCPTGVPGLDEVTNGGLPRDRTTLVCGTAGCGKTLFGMQFLVNGIMQHGEASDRRLRADVVTSMLPLAAAARE
jgi:circadian clock protein KaiC